MSESVRARFHLPIRRCPCLADPGHDPNFGVQQYGAINYESPRLRHGSPSYFEIFEKEDELRRSACGPHG
jgi:hypothetical protein